MVRAASKGESNVKGKNVSKCVSSCKKTKSGSRARVMSVHQHEKLLGFGAELNEAGWVIPSDKVMRSIWSRWTVEEKRLIQKMDSLTKIQEYVDTLGYDPADGCRSVRTTLSIGKAHCQGGAVVAYYLMTRLGYECGLIGFDAVNDDGHAIVAFRVKQPSGFYTYGAIGKSNFSGLRCRDAVFFSLRELVMSYYNFHFNCEPGEKTLISWNGPWSGWEYSGRKTKGDEDVADVYPWLFSGELCDDFDEAWDVEVTSYPVLLPKDEIRKEGRKQRTVGNRRIGAFMLASSNLIDSGKLGGNPDGYH